MFWASPMWERPEAAVLSAGPAGGMRVGWVQSNCGQWRPHSGPAGVRTAKAFPSDAIGAELLGCRWPAKRFLELEVAERFACQPTQLPLLLEGLPGPPKLPLLAAGPST